MTKQKTRTYTGINIQHPISQLIVNGTKTIETRTYPIPKKFVGKELVIIETPGSKGTFKARIIGIVIFGESFKYDSKKDFYADSGKHCVTPESIWHWTGEVKWGWPILKVTGLPQPLPAPSKKGIKYTTNISL